MLKNEALTLKLISVNAYSKAELFGTTNEVSKWSRGIIFDSTDMIVSFDWPRHKEIAKTLSDIHDFDMYFTSTGDKIQFQSKKCNFLFMISEDSLKNCSECLLLNRLSKIRISNRTNIPIEKANLLNRSS